VIKRLLFMLSDPEWPERAEDERDGRGIVSGIEYFMETSGNKSEGCLQLKFKLFNLGKKKRVFEGN
jgi:hypothetical protein